MSFEKEQQEIKRLQRRLDVMQLDQAWEQQRRRRIGGQNWLLEPTYMFALGSIGACALGIAGLVMWLGSGNLVMAWLSLIIGVSAAIYSYRLMRSYMHAKNSYLERRLQLTSQHQPPSAPQYSEE